jgi:mannosyl-oligosaccharide glucosidase
LYKYYRKNTKAVEIYTELRENIIYTVCGNWRDTGMFYEHYNQRQDGAGRGHHPFNGWTSLVSLIITENYE